MAYSGKEGKLYSKEASQSLIKSYTDLYGETKEYTKFEVIGKETILALNVPGAVAVRVYNSYDGIQTGIVLIPVDKDGKELEIPKSAQNRPMSDPPIKCPTSCG